MKSMMKATVLTAAALVGGAVVSTTANASGFEKSIVWGGRSAGVAGIASPYIQGSDALYFNPAGLVTNKVGNTLGLNVSPTMPQFKGPITNSNAEQTTESKSVFPLGLTYGRTFNDQWGMGVGFFVSGGAQASFKDLDYPNSSYKPEVKTDLQIFEASAGVGYKASEQLKLGLAWRVVMAQADFSFLQRASATAAANAKLTGLKDTQAVAFRAGAQYQVDENTSLGLVFRSEVNFSANGKAQVTGFSSAGGGGAAGTEQDATARTTFPMAITLGGLHKVNEDWNVLAEYVWTQYSRVGEIVVDSTAFATTGNQSRLKTDWRDQHNIRVAAEYMTTAWPVRFGYIWTNSVTNPDFARASFAPAAPAHTLTLGTGKGFKAGDSAEDNMRFDAGLEYTFSSGDGGASQATAGVTTPSASYDVNARAGTYSVTAYAAHLGLSYMF